MLKKKKKESTGFSGKSAGVGTGSAVLDVVLPAVSWATSSWALCPLKACVSSDGKPKSGLPSAAFPGVQPQSRGSTGLGGMEEEKRSV